MLLCNFSRFRGARMPNIRPSASSSASSLGLFPSPMTSSSSSASSAVAGHNRPVLFGTNPQPQRYPTASLGIDPNSAAQQKTYSSVNARSVYYLLSTSSRSRLTYVSSSSSFIIIIITLLLQPSQNFSRAYGVN